MDNPGLVRGYGLLPSKAVSSGIKEPSGSSSDDKARIIAEVRRLADEETKPVREKMEERHEEMVKRHKEMMEEMDCLRNTMMAMQRSVSAQDNTGPVLLGFGGCTDNVKKQTRHQIRGHIIISYITTEEAKKMQLCEEAGQVLAIKYFY